MKRCVKRESALDHNAARHRLAPIVIGSFACTETEKIWQAKGSRKLPTDIQRAALRRLLTLNAARSLSDLRSPGNNLETLRGKLAGLHSIRINKQWRICFRWLSPDAHDVQIVDYH
jgi:toxin HigB-1